MSRLGPILLLIALVSMTTRVSGFIFSRRRSSSVHQSTSHVSTNNCHCNNKQFIGQVASWAALLSMLQGGKLGKRDVAEVLDLEENYPGLEEFLQDAGTDSNGMVDKRDFVDSVKRASSQQSQSNSPNLCHCGRQVVDQFNFEP